MQTYTIKIFNTRTDPEDRSDKALVYSEDHNAGDCVQAMAQAWKVFTEKDTSKYFNEDDYTLSSSLPNKHGKINIPRIL